MVYVKGVCIEYHIHCFHLFPNPNPPLVTFKIPLVEPLLLQDRFCGPTHSMSAKINSVCQLLGPIIGGNDTGSPSSLDG